MSEVKCRTTREEYVKECMLRHIQHILFNQIEPYISFVGRLPQSMDMRAIEEALGRVGEELSDLAVYRDILEVKFTTVYLRCMGGTSDTPPCENTVCLHGVLFGGGEDTYSVCEEHGKDLDWEWVQKVEHRKT